MHPPIFVRELSRAERAQLEASLRAPSAFTVRRAQIVLLSAAGRRPSEIAPGLCCAVQTVRNGIRAFNAGGLAALTAGSSRPRSAAPVLDGAKRERLRARSAAPIAARLRPATQHLDAGPAGAGGARAGAERDGAVGGDDPPGAPASGGGLAARQAPALTSPDPAYARKKAGATA
jgi:DNA-binding CsgD family transcriptional regulator